MAGPQGCETMQARLQSKLKRHSVLQVQKPHSGRELHRGWMESLSGGFRNKNNTSLFYQSGTRLTLFEPTARQPFPPLTAIFHQQHTPSHRAATVSHAPEGAPGKGQVGQAGTRRWPPSPQGCASALSGEPGAWNLGSLHLLRSLKRQEKNQTLSQPTHPPCPPPPVCIR